MKKIVKNREKKVVFPLISVSTVKYFPFQFQCKFSPSLSTQSIDERAHKKNF